MPRTEPIKNSLPETKSRRLDAAVAFLKRYPDISISKAASIYTIDPTSIRKRLSGKIRSQEVCAQQRQSLTPIEEVLSKWALQYWAWGLPLTIANLKQFALEILQRKQVSNPQIGKNWHLRFLTRNATIKTKLSSPLDRSRVSACIPDNMKSFFNLFKKIVLDNQIKTENIHNMDKKDTLMGYLNREYILVPKEAKNAYISQDESREWVSSLENIRADGSTIDTFVIVKGIYFRQDLFDHATPGMTVATSENG
jgi:hypothetical protein